MRHSRQQQKSVIAALTDSRQKTRVNHFQARPCPIKIKHKSSFLIQHQKKELDLWKSFYCFRIFFTIEKFHQSPWLEFITWRLSLQWHIFWIHTEGPFHHKKLSLASLASFSASLSRFLFLAFSFLLSTLPLFSPPAPFPPALPLSPGCFFFSALPWPFPAASISSSSSLRLSAASQRTQIITSVEGKCYTKDL